MTEWMQDAACRDYDTDFFFPVKGVASGRALRAIEDAKAVCLACPVLAECRDYILSDHPRYEDDFGIFAALSPEDRHRARFLARNQRQRERRRQRKHNKP